MNANAIFGANDDQVNGDVLVYTREGEVYEADDRFQVLVPNNLGHANNPQNFEPIPITRQGATAFLAMNFHWLKVAVPELNDVKASEISYLRLLAVKYRLMSPDYDANAYHVDYNQCEFLMNNANTATLSVNQILANDDEGFPAIGQPVAQAALLAHLTLDRRRVLNKAFCNMVCLVAYMFRTRGHHYHDDYQQKYENMWNKTATHELVINLTWKEIALYALHAIIPQILDQYYVQSANLARCDAILTLRVNSAAAGTALFPVLAQGLEDLRTVLPQIDKVMPDAIDYIKNTNNELANNRWRHSINARYYGEARDRLDESQTGAVGALLRSCVDTLAANSDIINSKALQRAAKLAPITGAAYGQAIKNYVRSDRFLALGNM